MTTEAHRAIIKFHHVDVCIRHKFINRYMDNHMYRYAAC